jgi:hypothetical protein
MSTTTTPNMGMVLPVPSSEPGPAWATELITALTSKVDAHNHAGIGLTLGTSALNINADLPFNTNYNATLLRSTRYVSQSAVLSLGTDIGCLYNFGGLLYWNNNAGTPIQITTAGGAVNSASALTGPVVGTARTVTTTYSVDSVTPDYYLNCDTTGGAFNVTLPAPTTGRTLVLNDVKGNFGVATLTLVPHVAEKINLIAANKLLTAAGAQYLIQSNGTDWFVAGS